MRALKILPPADGAAEGIYVFRLLAIEEDTLLAQRPQAAPSKRAATEEALRWIGRCGQPTVDYVTGAGADPRYCAPFPYRQRAPGAGQKKKPKALARVTLNARVRPDVLRGLKARARGGKSLGEVLDAAYDATQQNLPRGKLRNPKTGTTAHSSYREHGVVSSAKRPFPWCAPAPGGA